jgi:hypothetical protein
MSEGMVIEKWLIRYGRNRLSAMLPSQ